MHLTLFKVGFLDVDIWDFFDVLIVGVLLYQLYRLLKGSIALNIFVGMVL
ncbi:MAG: TIGR00159 family protein, partial [Bacteroidota bacterium]